MRSVVIDEGLPRSFGGVFADHGFQVLDVRDLGARGASDSAVFSIVLAHHAALATGDVAFAERTHIFERHHGVFLIRLPEVISLATRCRELNTALGNLGNYELENHIVVVALGAVRVHGRVDLKPVL